MIDTNPLIEIRQWSESDSLTELTELLHRAYKTLADMGLRFFATHQTEEQTLERISDGTCLVGIMDQRIVATITYYSPGRSDGTPWYARPDVACFGQFAVAPELQKSGIGSMLLQRVEELAQAAEVPELALDTAEGATHLIEYYSRRGYRFIEYTQWDVTNYRSVVMSKTLTIQP